MADYCELDDLVERFGLQDSNDDTQLERVITAASRRIETYTGRPRFWNDPTVTTRTFYADSNRSLRVPLGIASTSGLIVKTDDAATGAFGTTLTANTDFLLRPDNALTDGWPYDELWLADNFYFPVLANGRPGVQITARFGWPAIPADITEACIILAHRLYKRKDTASGVIGFDGIGAAVRLSRTDPDVAELLDPYRIIAAG